MAMTCGEATIRLLAKYGITKVFGIPGVHTLDMCRGLSGGENSFVGKSAAYSTHISRWPLVPGILSLPSLPANTHQHWPLPEPHQPGRQALCPLDGIPQEAMSGYSGAV